MPSPFPGMDPFLEEQSEVWPDVHHGLAEELKGQLNPQIGPKYYATVEIQMGSRGVELESAPRVRPDTSVLLPLDSVAEMPATVATIALAPAPVVRVITEVVTSRVVRIYKTKTSELVTSVEILSPYNKRPYGGLEEYQQKRSQLLKSAVHLVEIDLLRGGVRPGQEILEDPLDTDYVLLVNRADYERASEIWPVAVNEVLPLIPVPLQKPDPDVALDVGAALRAVYARSGYDWRIHYDEPVPPPELQLEMAAWVNELLATKLRRTA